MTAIPHYVYQAKAAIEDRDYLNQMDILHIRRGYDMGARSNHREIANLEADIAKLGVTEINDYDYYSSVDEGTELYDFYMESLS